MPLKTLLYYKAYKELYKKKKKFNLEPLKRNLNASAGEPETAKPERRKKDR